jgi:GRAM domain
MAQTNVRELFDLQSTE